MLIVLVLLPLLLAGIAWVIPSDRVRIWLVPVAGLFHLALTIAALFFVADPAPTEWFGLDPLNRVVLLQVSVVVAVCAVYTPGYLSIRHERKNRVFVSALMAFFAAMTGAILARHVGLMWVTIEASTLSAAPLLYFGRNRRSIEATWKYLLIGSVGVAIALLGSFFLAYSAVHAGLESSLFFADLQDHAPQLSRPWLHAAFVLLFVGYGTKMGLAPMHTWKPDAYGEAPGLVGALLAGGLTSCAFLALLRFYRLAGLAGEADVVENMFVSAGLFSMAVAAVFMVRQQDFKRMLAWSSVEHMGILVLGVGLGGGAVFGAMLHLVANALAKGVMFLSAGNIHRAFGSKRTDEVHGALRRVPLSAGLFLVGFFAVTGAPPFAPFLSEFTILDAAVASGQYVAAGAFVVLLFAVFVGMGITVLSVVQGEPPAKSFDSGFRDRFRTAGPIVACLVLVVLLGVWVPAPLEAMLRDAADYVTPKSAVAEAR